ncbi:MAG TPA: hypothetical protein VKA87_11415 [Nitrososphaeraceae archaeon]|nr:hypothetical protein [Nitrososphaeraceae archaeon]
MRFNIENSVDRALVIAHIHTDSTGRLAPLEGMILTSIEELYPDESCMFTLWEWQSGIPLSSTIGEPPLMNTTTTMTTTNATTNTTAADTNATASAPPEEGGVEEEQKQQQTTPTILPNPLFE